MKKVTSFLLAVLVILLGFTSSGCSSDLKSLRDEDLSTLVKLPDYKNIEIDTTSLSYQMGLKYSNYSNLVEILEDIPETGLDEGVVQILDTAIIDYVGKKDGVEFEGGSDKGHDLLIGSSSFISGFEEGLVGVKVGETVTLNLTFPEDYQSADLAGEDVVFTVTVKGILRPELPEITDTYAAYFGCSTADEYLQQLEASYFYQYVWTEFLSLVEITNYPEYAVDDYIETNINLLETEAVANDTTLDDYLASSGYSVESYKEEVLIHSSEAYVKNVMAAYYFAELEGITVSDGEFENYLSKNYSGKELSLQEREDVYESMMVEKAVEKLALLVKTKTN